MIIEIKSLHYAKRTAPKAFEIESENPLKVVIQEGLN
jgi:hypothetical protein